MRLIKYIVLNCYPLVRSRLSKKRLFRNVQVHCCVITTFIRRKNTIWGMLNEGHSAFFELPCENNTQIFKKFEGLSDSHNILLEVPVFLEWMLSMQLSHWECCQIIFCWNCLRRNSFLALEALHIQNNVLFLTILSCLTRKNNTPICSREYDTSYIVRFIFIYSHHPVLGVRPIVGNDSARDHGTPTPFGARKMR